MHKSVTRNIEIEIPHQIYITQYLLGEVKNIQVLLEEEDSMQKGNVNLESHAYGKIITKNDNILVMHESDLTTDTTRKEVIIICENNIIVKGKYLIYDKNLNKIENGSVQVYKNHKRIYSQKFEMDDNMYECLWDFYYYFNHKNIRKDYKKQILTFSKEMNLLI